MSQLQPQQQNQGILQPYIPPEFVFPCDFNNSLHCSRFSYFTGLFLRLGDQHPDDKKKTAHQWFQEQKEQLASTNVQKLTEILAYHYPGQLTAPKSTTENYKECVKQVSVSMSCKQKITYLIWVFRSKLCTKKK